MDFILIDWSNNCEFTYKNGCNRPDLRFIQDATKQLFRVWSTITPRPPSIAIMIGSPEDATRYTKEKGAALKAKADEVWELFVEPYRNLYFTYHNKPLLVDYVGRLVVMWTTWSTRKQISGQRMFHCNLFRTVCRCLVSLCTISRHPPHRDAVSIPQQRPPMDRRPVYRAPHDGVSQRPAQSAGAALREPLWLLCVALLSTKAV